jgi:hypothetical protein
MGVMGEMGEDGMGDFGVGGLGLGWVVFDMGRGDRVGLCLPASAVPRAIQEGFLWVL